MMARPETMGMRFSECLSSIFCVADLYDPDAGREDYELDDVQLHERIKSILEQFPG
jgi:methionine-rich copper-binding protein CopC